MLKPIRSRKIAAVAAILTAFLLTISPALWAQGPERLLPGGTVKVYRGDQLVSVLSEEAPLPEGAILEPQGQCGMRLDDLYLVADDGSRFSVASAGNGHALMIEKGVVFFAMSGATGPLTFRTPGGDIVTQRLILNASAEGGLLKGYVDAAPEGTHIGVLDGGSLVVLTADGEKTITSGRQITLAQANLFDEAPAEDAPGEEALTETEDEGLEGEELAAEEDEDEIPAAYFWGGGALLAAGGVAIAADGGGGGGGGGAPASPASP